MKHKHRPRRCLSCKQPFVPDSRSRFHQRYCSEPECRKVSKLRSQKRWLTKSENRNHWCGANQVDRVRQWRQKHPKYWKRRIKPAPLQDDSKP